MAGARRFWVILAGDMPTAFRGNDRDALLPTLHQLQRTQPNITLKWLERNRIWTDPDEARDAQRAERDARVRRRPERRLGGGHADSRATPQIPRGVKRTRFKLPPRWDARDQRPP